LILGLYTEKRIEKKERGRNRKELKEKMTNTYIEIASNKFKQEFIGQWNLLLNHRFITEMGDGLLPLNKFAFYLEQDHIFLKEFCVFLLNAKEIASHKPKLEQWLNKIYISTVKDEMQMQAELLSSLAISLAERKDINYNNNGSLTCNNAASATTKYISFLKTISKTGSLEETISALAPCPWSYLEISQELSSKHTIKAGAYKRWTDFYSSKESKQQVQELKNFLGEAYLVADKNKQKLMKRNFAAACKHEYDFWEMAYNTKM
jgi:thiaminase/transcriptional activator TenA